MGDQSFKWLFFTQLVTFLTVAFKWWTDRKDKAVVKDAVVTSTRVAADNLHNAKEEVKSLVIEKVDENTLVSKEAFIAANSHNEKILALAKRVVALEEVLIKDKK